jgi:hypothetical protein
MLVEGKRFTEFTVYEVTDDEYRLVATVGDRIKVLVYP